MFGISIFTLKRATGTFLLLWQSGNISGWRILSTTWLDCCLDRFRSLDFRLLMNYRLFFSSEF
jgi:hypothetical protein